MKKLLFVALILCGSLIKSSDENVRGLQQRLLEQDNGTKPCNLYYSSSTHDLVWTKNAFNGAAWAVIAMMAFMVLENERRAKNSQGEQAPLNGQANQMILSNSIHFALWAVAMVSAFNAGVSFTFDAIVENDLQYEIRSLQDRIAAMENCTLSS
jgi:hypothetical protein